MCSKGKGWFIGFPCSLSTPGPAMTVPCLISDTQTLPLPFTYIGVPKRWMGMSKISWGGPSRWQRSKTCISTSSPQKHQNYVYMWNNSYRTPTERWQKTSDFPKAIWLKGSWFSSWCQAWTSEVGELSSGHWTTREVLAPRNINQEELSQRSPSQG